MSSTPILDLSAIPEEQRAAVLAVLQERDALKALNQRLEHLVAELKQLVHGKKSEKLTEEQAIAAPLVRAQWRPATGLRGSGNRRGRG